MYALSRAGKSYGRCFEQTYHKNAADDSFVRMPFFGSIFAVQVNVH